MSRIKFINSDWLCLCSVSNWQRLIDITLQRTKKSKDQDIFSDTFSFKGSIVITTKVLFS